jgi:hypothetical protein
MAKKQMKFDPFAMVHRTLSFEFHGARLKGRVVAAGYRTPVIVYRGDITPHPYIVVSPEGAEDYTSTNPRDTVEIGVGSLTWDTIRWNGVITALSDLFRARTSANA